jgi:HSP20 family protein
MTMMRRTPTAEMINRLMDYGWSHQDSGPRPARLAMDAYSNEDEIVVIAAVPGIDPEAVEITVEDDVLTIQGEIPARLENVDYIFAERFHGPFSRQLHLNTKVNVDEIEASFKDGVLTLVLPKAEEAKPKVIKVQAK